MSKVLIVPLGLLTQPKWQDSVNAFKALGVGKLSLLWNWPRVNRAIKQYKIGATNNELFLQNLQTIFPQLNNIEERNFWHAWNQSCGFTEKTQEDLDALCEMKRRDVQIYIISRSNPAHIAFIKKQYGKALPGDLFLSYEQGTIDASLTDALMQEINKKHPDVQPENIVHLRSEPGEKPYPNLWSKLGWLRWLLAPFQMLQYAVKQRAFRTIEQQEVSLGFTGCNWPADNTLAETLQKQILIEQLSAKGTAALHAPAAQVLDIEDLASGLAVTCMERSARTNQEAPKSEGECPSQCLENCKAKKRR